MKKILIIFTICISALCLTACGAKTYDLHDFVTPSEVEGYTESISLVTPEFDDTALEYISDSEDRSDLQAVLDTMQFKIDPSKNVHNGDEITVTAVWDEKMAKNRKVKFKNTTWTITAEGIMERMTEEDVDSFFSESSETGQAAIKMIDSDTSVHADKIIDIKVERTNTYLMRAKEKKTVNDYRGLSGDYYFDVGYAVYKVTYKAGSSFAPDSALTSGEKWYIMTTDYIYSKDALTETSPKYIGIPGWTESQELAIKDINTIAESSNMELTEVR